MEQTRTHRIRREERSGSAPPRARSRPRGGSKSGGSLRISVMRIRLPFDLREDDARRREGGARREPSPRAVPVDPHVFHGSAPGNEGLPQLLRRGRGERGHQQRGHPGRLEGVVENRPQPGALSRVLRQRPRLRRLHVFVPLRHELDDRPERLVERHLVHRRGHGRQAVAPAGGQGRVLGFGGARLGDDAGEIFPEHPERPVQQVAQLVGELRIGALDQFLLREVAVQPEGDFAQQEVTERVRPEFPDHLVRVDDVPQRLAHLLPLDGPPSVGEHPERRRDPRGHEERRPVDGVEPEDVLPHHVDVGGPERPELRRGRRVPQPGDVVREGVVPDVDDVSRRLGHGDPPGERGAGDGQVVQPPLDEGDHLVAAALRPDERRVSSDSSRGAAPGISTGGKSRTAPSASPRGGRTSGNSRPQAAAPSSTPRRGRSTTPRTRPGRCRRWRATFGRGPARRRSAAAPWCG